MSPVLLQRQAALAAVALLATLGVLALSRGDDVAAQLRPTDSEIPWQSAVVGVLPPRDHRETACGSTLDSGTIGVAHPALPCGVDLVVARGGRQIRAEVVDHRHVSGGLDFDLTKALADRLGVTSGTTIQWRFAG